MVELIPKKQRKPVFSQIFFIIISLAVAAGTGTGFFILEQVRASTELALESLDRVLIEDTRPLEMELETELETSKKKVEGLRAVLQERRNFLAFFSIIERSTHPDVSFESFEGTSESERFVLAGNAKDFVILEQQRQAWNTQSQFESVAIKDMGFTKDGRAGFEVEFLLKTDVLAQ